MKVIISVAAGAAISVILAFILATRDIGWRQMQRQLKLNNLNHKRRGEVECRD